MASSPLIHHAGCGIADITGPPLGRLMMGYAKSGQATNGIHTRLWARAFVLHDTEQDTFVVMVVADLSHIFQGVKLAVADALAEGPLRGVFDEKNVLLSATHTHSGPGGYARHRAFNATIAPMLVE